MTQQHLRRHAAWRARLAAEMDRQRRIPFAWGRHDCAIGFAAAIVEAVTGTDLARGFRGKYRGPTAALRLLRTRGAATLEDFAAQLLPEIHPIDAQVGDLGIVLSDGPVAEGFCMVDTSGLVVLTEDGHGRRPRTDMIRAFAVGRN